MVQYLQLLHHVMEHGRSKADRTGTGTLSVFGAQARFPLSQGFPLVTTKKVHLKSIIYELLWFLRGETNVRWLQERGVTIWDEWADQTGNLGRIYGAQWCDWRTGDGRSINQVDHVIEQLRANPDSRRLIVTAWNPGELKGMALPPCHALFQFYAIDGELSCQLYQRSADILLGVPFNIASCGLTSLIIPAMSSARSPLRDGQGEKISSRKAASPTTTGNRSIPDPCMARTRGRSQTLRSHFFSGQASLKENASSGRV